MTVTLTPRHTGFVPIATCHWQSLSNILAEAGFADAERSLCPSWGVRWPGGGVLFGAGRWRRQVAVLFDVRIDERCFEQLAECERFELSLSAAGVPFVVEVDAFYLASQYRDVAHVVHTVVVVARRADSAVIIDTTNNPVPATVPIDEYLRMRGSPCDGRLEPYKLYTCEPARYRTPPPAEILRAIGRERMAYGAADLEQLYAFVDWYARGTEPINVCRTAAERHGAAALFDVLAARRVEGAAEMAQMLHALAEDWYMVHMLTVHPKADGPSHRGRVLRFLHRLADAEQGVHRRVLRSSWCDARP